MTGALVVLALCPVGILAAAGGLVLTHLSNRRAEQLRADVAAALAEVPRYEPEPVSIEYDVDVVPRMPS